MFDSYRDNVGGKSFQSRWGVGLRGGVLQTFSTFSVIKGSHHLVLQLETYFFMFFKCPLINLKRSHAQTNNESHWLEGLVLAESQTWLQTVGLSDCDVLFAGSACQCPLMWYTHGWMAPTWHSWRNWKKSRSKWKRNRKLGGISFGFQCIGCPFLYCHRGLNKYLWEFTPEFISISIQAQTLALSFTVIGTFRMRSKVRGGECFSR